MRPRPSILLVVSCLLVGAVLASIGSVAGAPPPRPLCDACGEQFETTAERQGLSIAVDRSTARVVVHDDGSATWIVHNRLADSASVARLRADDQLRTAIAERAMWNAEFRTVTVSSNGSVILRYRDPDFAEPSVGGVLRSGALTEAYGYRNLDGLGADRLTIVAPDGMEVGRAVPEATVSDDGSRLTLTTFEDGGLLTFTPRESAIGPVLSVLALVGLVGPDLVLIVTTHLLVPAALFGLVVGAAGRGLSRAGDEFGRFRDRVGIGLAILGVLVTAVTLVARGLGLLGGMAAPLFGSGIAVAALGGLFSRPAIRDAASYRTLVGGAVVGTVVAAGFTIGGSFLFHRVVLPHSIRSTLPALVPLFSLFPAGYALGQDRPRLAVGTAAVGYLLPTLPLVSPGVGVSLFVLVVATTVVGVIALLGLPLLVSGYALGRR